MPWGLILFLSIIIIIIILIVAAYYYISNALPNWLSNLTTTITGGITGAVQSITKLSYPRDAGSMPVCAPGADSEGGLCYTTPQAGYKCTATMCLKTCPADMTDTGLDCLKNSNTRPSSPIDSCPWGQEKDGELCYPICNPGYVGVGPVCWQTCPSGYTDMGLTCSKTWDDGYYNYSWGSVGCTGGRPFIPQGYSDCYKTWIANIKTDTISKDSYGRGAGNPLGCAPGKELNGALCYPICNSGYKGVGPVCWETCPYGFTDVGISCQKPTYDRGVGTIPGTCPDGTEKDPDGLCYQTCKAGYHGVGPVCWENMTNRDVPEYQANQATSDDPKLRAILTQG